MKPISNYSAFERIIPNMTRTFGKVQKGNEDNFALELSTIEFNLLKMYRKNKSNNGVRASEAVKISLFTIDGYINECEYDLSKYKTPENEALTYAILMAFDPFTNETVRNALTGEYDLHSPVSLREYFTILIQCLLRINDSIDLWTKRNGSDGYFTFLEEFIGNVVPADEKMDFAVRSRPRLSD